jgi:serine/threonine protein kinase
MTFMTHHPSAVIGKYELITELATSTFSTVWLAEHTQVHCPVVLKIIPKAIISSPQDATRLIRELNLLYQMNHAFIVKTFENFDDDDYHYCVMENASGGSLAALVRESGPMTEFQARHVFLQLIYALEYLHETSCVPHRDLRPENILLDKHGNLRLIDFGLAGSVLGERKVTAFSAPSVAAKQRYSVSADVWSAGATLFFLVAGYPPFQGESSEELVEQIMGESVSFPASASKALVDLLTKMLNRDNGERITLPKIKEHPWFSITDFLQMKRRAERDAAIVDSEIIARLARCGYETKWLSAARLAHRGSEHSVLYEMLKREKTTDTIHEALLAPPDPPDPPRASAPVAHSGPQAPRLGPRMSGAPSARRMPQIAAREEGPKQQQKVLPKRAHVRTSHSAFISS